MARPIRRARRPSCRGWRRNCRAWSVSSSSEDLNGSDDLNCQETWSLMNALVVDDSRAIRRILSGMLTDIGFAVAEASHGKEALAHLQANASSPARPHLVLVDWNMPEMNGLELVQAVRKDQRFASIPLMMVTTETEMAQVLRALE